MRIFVSIFYLLAIIALAACSKSEETITEVEIDLTEECEAIEGPAEILIPLDESKLFIPYPDSIQAVVFSDSLGHEYVAKVIRNRTYRTTAFGGIRCPLDNNIFVNYRWDLEVKEIRFQIEALELELSLQINPGWTFDTKDSMSIIVSDYCNASIWSSVQDTSRFSLGGILLDVNPRGNPKPNRLYSAFEDSLIIHGVTFENVYISYVKDWSWYRYDMYYNKSKGLIGFRDSQNPNVFLKYVRIE